MKAVAHCSALVTLATTFVLILFGGLVTNTGAALAVPDWPNTFGYNMFLFPWAQMVGGIFYEHSHRLVGAVTGLLTLALAAAAPQLGADAADRLPRALRVQLAGVQRGLPAAERTAGGRRGTAAPLIG